MNDSLSVVFIAEVYWHDSFNANVRNLLHDCWEIRENGHWLHWGRVKLLPSWFHSGICFFFYWLELKLLIKIVNYKSRGDNSVNIWGESQSADSQEKMKMKKKRKRQEMINWIVTMDYFLFINRVVLPAGSFAQSHSANQKFGRLSPELRLQCTGRHPRPFHLCSRSRERRLQCKIPVSWNS